MTDRAYRPNVSDGVRWAVRPHAEGEGITHTAVRPGRRGETATVETVEIIRRGLSTIYVCDHAGVERADPAMIAACLAHCDAPADWVAQAAEVHDAVSLMRAVGGAGRTDDVSDVVVCVPRRAGSSPPGLLPCAPSAMPS